MKHLLDDKNMFNDQKLEGCNDKLMTLLLFYKIGPIEMYFE